MPAVRRAQIGAVAQYSNARKACQPSLLRQVYGTSKSLIHGLFPATCLLCLDPGQPPALDLCRDCEDDLPRNSGACAGCAMPLPGPGAPCGAVPRAGRPFDAAFAPYRYEFPLVELIHRLKYGRQVAIARILGTVLAHRLASAARRAVDALVPVPLHARARGAPRLQPGARDRALRRRSSSALPVLDRAGPARARDRGAGGAPGERAPRQRARRVRGAAQAAAGRASRSSTT